MLYACDKSCVSQRKVRHFFTSKKQLCKHLQRFHKPLVGPTDIQHEYLLQNSNIPEVDTNFPTVDTCKTEMVVTPFVTPDVCADIPHLMMLLLTHAMILMTVLT
jgi:hypothetical protein